MEKVVIAGAGFAGLQTALSLGRKGYNVEIIDRSQKHIYTPGLIDLVRNRCKSQDLELDLEKFFRDTSIDFFKDEIQEIKPENSKIIGEEEAYSYDYLVLALGGAPILPENFNNVISPYNLEESSKLRNITGKTAVIGSGYAGIEFASELNEKNLETSIFDLKTRPLSNFPEKVSEKVLEILVDTELSFRGGKKIEKVEDSEIFFEDSSEEFENIIASMGVKTPDLVSKDFEGAVQVNKGLCSIDYDNIFAIGTCNNLSDSSAHNAIKEAKLVAENISKKEYEDLEPFNEDSLGDLVAMGGTGLFIWKERVFEGRLFRYVKDLVRKTYFLNLKRQRWMLKNLM